MPVTGFVLCAFKPIPATKRKNKVVTAVVANITAHEMEIKFSSGLVRNKNREPNNTEITPQVASNPWLMIFISSTKRIMPKIIKDNPA